MKVIKKRALALLVVLVMCFQFGTIPTKAAANVVIYLSSSSVSIGQSVTATVSISGSDISAYTIYVSYSSSILQYNSASGATVGGGGGTLTISGTGAGSISISFTAIANGSASISTSGSEVYDINYNAISISHAGATVTVATADNNSNNNNNNDNDKEKDKTTEEKKEDEKKEEEDDDRSNNCNLASLQVSPGTLSPSFSASTTSYSLQVDEDVTSIVVSATAEDSKASTAVSGANSIQKGENTVRVTVTAENGAVRVYSIRVIAGEDVGEAKATIDGKDYSFVNSEEGLEVPEGFTAEKIEYKDWEVLAFQSPNKKFYIVCLYNDDVENAWYIIDAEKDTFTPYKEFSSEYNRYILIPVPEGVEVPAGFSQKDIKIGDIAVSAYQSENIDDANLYLVYAMNLDGEEGFYLYDSLEGAFIRYVPMVVTEEVIVEATPTVATPLEPVKETKDEGFFTRQMLIYFLIGSGALLIILLVCVIIFAGRIRKQNQEIADADDMISQLASANKNVNSELFEKLDQDDMVEEQEADIENADFYDQSNADMPAADASYEDQQAVDEIEKTIDEKIDAVENIDTIPEIKTMVDDAIGQIEIPTVKTEENKTSTKSASALDTFSAAGEAYVEKSEQELAHEDYEKRSEEINNKIMTNYDANKDSVFASDDDTKA